MIRPGARSKDYEDALLWLQDLCLRLWTAAQNGKAEDIVPVEVKAERNLSAKSLFSYHKKFGPKMMVRFSMGNISLKEGLLGYPLGMATWLPKRIQRLL